MENAEKWIVFEMTLASERAYNNPFWDGLSRFIITGPSNSRYAREALWDGEGSWRVRFCPDDVWRWRPEFSTPEDGRRHHQRGVSF